MFNMQNYINALQTQNLQFYLQDSLFDYLQKHKSLENISSSGTIHKTYHMLFSCCFY